MVNIELIPKATIIGLRAFADRGVPPGHFIRACLENNFMNVVGYADHENTKELPSIASYIYNEIPAASHGSKERVDSWIASKAKERENAVSNG